MKLDKELLHDDSDDVVGNFNSCLNARGLYDSMQFVLRLRPDIHHLLEGYEDSIIDARYLDNDTIQAFSTYFHETIHWWQHVGSISGFLLSLSYPIQAHANIPHLRKFLKLTGPIKPITKYNLQYAKEFKPENDEFKTINIILNNYHDIEFFKYRLIIPNSMTSIIKNPLFESVGHSFNIAYGNLINLLSSSFDRELQFLPNAKLWDEEFQKLTKSEIDGYYYGSPVGIPPIGLKEIYEGQARFLQLQYLYLASGKSLTWDDFEEAGMLTGEYYSAFKLFLELIDSERPDSVDSPVVALFLLTLDLAMNPTDGFPFDIYHFPSFIESTDPGIRFIMLCQSIAHQHPELKSYIQDYSSSEYYEVTTKLSKAIACYSPLEAASKISDWANNQPSIIKLMEEESTFQFSNEDQPIRLMFSQFIKYQLDKLQHPEFFCWPSMYMAGKKCTDNAQTLFGKHKALFIDKADGDIYPTIPPGKEQSFVQTTFNTFYTWVATYDLCSQWITREGAFEFDYFWLTSKYSFDELEEWASEPFKSLFNIKPNSFSVIE